MVLYGLVFLSKQYYIIKNLFAKSLFRALLFFTWNFETSYDIYMSFVNKANGDIYALGLDRDEPAYYFYKIENTWDSELISLWQTKKAANSFMLQKLTTSSLLTERTDKNAYHSIKLFDDDSKTMWIENIKGPGISEKISFSFAKDITIDKITFQPGCFWDKYWKQKNRVKKCG